MSVPTIRFLHPYHLGRPGSLEAITQVLIEEGFSIYHMYNEPFAIETEKHNPNTEAIREGTVIAYEKGQIHIGVSDDLRGGELQIRFEMRWSNNLQGQPIKQHICIKVSKYSRALFTNKRFEPEYYAQRLLSLGKRLYNVLHPTFGWIDQCPPHGYTNDQHVTSLAVPHIYWANFFGPSYVARLGEPFLLNVPVGKIEILEDDGILYVLTSELTRREPLKKVEKEANMYFSGF